MIDAKTQVDPEAVEQQLERVLQSRIFERAQRSQRFLRYLVDAALSEPPVSVKEYTVAVDVFDRGVTYDPAVDATVRVEASRLRSRLREFYDEEGRDDPWVIEVPKGAYAVALHRRPVPDAAVPESLAIAAVPEARLPAGETGAVPALTTGWPRRWVLALAAACLLVVVVGVAAAWRFGRSPARERASAPVVSLAIVPMVNKTGDASLSYVADGLTDDLIRQLSQVPALRLMARSTMFRYRDRAGDAGAIAKALHVDTVMTGELRRTPEHLSLAVEVSRTSDGSVLLDREYLADTEDLRVVQAEVQRDVLRKLSAESSALDPTRVLRSVTSSPQAYQEFLEGDALARNGAPPDLHQAIEHFAKAVALDPQFDLAWSALASEHVLLGLYFEAPREHMPVAREFAQRALQINPSLGEAHGSLGLIHLVYDWDLPAADAEMATAGAEEAAVSTLSCTAHLIEQKGRPRRAEEFLRRMLTFDPQSSSLMAELGCVDFYRGDYGAALRHYQEALAADPQSPVAYWGMGKTLNAQGKHAEAIRVLESFERRNGFEPPLLDAEMGYAMGASGDRGRALAMVRRLQTKGEQMFVDPYLLAVIYASMNDRDAAFASLKKALEVRSSFAISLLTEPKWEPFRGDPRFAALVEQMLHSKAG